MTNRHVVNAIALLLASMPFGPRKIRDASRREQALINELRRADGSDARRRLFHQHLRMIPSRQAASLIRAVIDVEHSFLFDCPPTEWRTIDLPPADAIRRFAARQIPHISSEMLSRTTALETIIHLLDASLDPAFVQVHGRGEPQILPNGEMFMSVKRADGMIMSSISFASVVSLRNKKTDDRDARPAAG
jgi:hypothetical protein